MEGTLLYQRQSQGDGEPVDSAEDIWDDSALIEAYDKAVKSAMDQIYEQDTEMPTPPHQSSGASRSERGKKKKKFKKDGGGKSSSMPAATRRWAVGDLCVALFSEDGHLYEATVESVNSRDGTCVVRYDHYDNAEVQHLRDLQERVGQVQIESETPAHQPQKPAGKQCNGKGPPPGLSTGPNGSAVGPVPPPQLPFNLPHSSAIPAIPPPPPPSSMPHCPSAANEREALSSMLISWYMSGYHSGYYQGLKDGKEKGKPE